MNKVSTLIIFVVLYFSFALQAEEGLSAFQTWKAEPSSANAGLAFANALNDQNAEQLEQLLNLDVLLSRTFSILGNPSGYKNMMKGAKQGLSENLYKTWFSLLEQSSGEARYRRMINVDEQDRALVMLDLGESGVNYIELIFDTTEPGIVDFYTHSSGEKASQSFAKVFGIVLPESSNFLKRLLGIKDIDKRVAETFKSVGVLNRQGRYEQAYKKLKSLPKEIRDSRIIALMLVFNSQNLEESIYRKELANLDKLYGDNEDLFLMLMDHYFYTEQYDKGLVGLKKLNNRLGNDASVINMMSVFYFLKGDLKLATKQIDDAIMLEEMNEDHYWFKGDILNEQGKFKELVQLFDLIESKFEVYIDPDELKAIEGYEKFSESKEFKQWKENKA